MLENSVKSQRVESVARSFLKKARCFADLSPSRKPEARVIRTASEASDFFFALILAIFGCGPDCRLLGFEAV